jgi:hypothetical protein
MSFTPSGWLLICLSDFLKDEQISMVAVAFSGWILFDEIQINFYAGKGPTLKKT